jgi:integrase
MPALQLVPIPAPEPPNPEPPKPRSHSRKQPPFLSEDEIGKLFCVIHSARDRAMFRVAYHAGLRASEIGKIEMRDYDARTERLSIHRLKGSNSGIHHLCREASRALHAWLKVRGKSPGVLFPSNRRGPLDRTVLAKLMVRYGEAAGIPRRLCHFHILKHSCCTHLLDKGVGIADVQDWVGHSNIQNTMKYAHMTNRRRLEVAEQLKDWK